MEIFVVMIGMIGLSYAGLAPFTEKNGDTPQSELTLKQRLVRQVTKKHF